MSGQLRNECIRHIDIQRLQEIIERPVAYRFLGVFKFPISAYDDKLSVQPLRFGPLHQIQPGDIRHPDIRKHQVRLLCTHGLPRFVSACKLSCDFETVFLPVKGVLNSSYRP
ncbi:hypothetical protein D3C74_432280 [compost metagenome]